MKKTLLIALFMAGCAHNTWTLEGTPQQPAAEGEVKATDGDNGNTKVELHVKHLAKADKVAPGTTTYVAWIEPITGDTHPQNVGAVALSDDLEGKLETVTAQHAFKLYVTPEAAASVTTPSGPHVLTATVNRDK